MSKFNMTWCQNASIVADVSLWSQACFLRDVADALWRRFATQASVSVVSFHAMKTRPLQEAKRAFVTVLLFLCQQYGLKTGFNRSSADAELEKAYRRVILKAHPDKGGSKVDFDKVHSAREDWRSAKNTSHAQQPPCGLDVCVREAKQYRIRSTAVLLTYMGIGVRRWQAFVNFVESSLQTWQALYWCATMEKCKSGKFHIHLMLQFRSASDVRVVQNFKFQKVNPNAACNDLCGEGLCRKRLQESINRGFFYVFADKIGTVEAAGGGVLTAGNYLPSWTESLLTYQVLGKWPETLWKQYKVTDAVYESYLVLCRDGVPARLRNLRTCQDLASKRAAETALVDRVKRVRSNPETYHPFPPVPAASAWLETFKKDALRYPVLIVLGPSRAGKTEWAKSLFQCPLELKIGCLTFFPDGMRRFQRGVHDGLVLDDVRDLQFVVDHQEKLQGKYDHLVEFGSTAGGTCAFSVDMYGVPVAVTINYSTANLDYLTTHDWLSKSGNRVIVQLPGEQCPNA